MCFAFNQNNSALSTDDFDIEDFSISYINNSKELLITSQNINEITEIELYNITGQKVRVYNSSTFNYINTEQSIRISTPYISEGVYIVKCNTIDSNYNGKVVIKQ